MTINEGHSTGLFFIFGWKGARHADGPYYVDGVSTPDQAIARAREALSAWPRTTAEDVHTGELVWDSQEPSRQDGKTVPVCEMSATSGRRVPGVCNGASVRVPGSARTAGSRTLQ